MTIRRGYVDTSIGQIHYRSVGTHGPVVVLLHQTASSSRMFEALMSALDGELQLVALDSPGFGSSDAFPRQPTIEDLAGVLAEAAHALGHERYHLFGHHTGAAIAGSWAAEHPERVLSLAMIGGLAMGADERARWSASIHAAPVQEDGSHLTAAWHRVGHIDAAPVLSPPDATLAHREAVDVLLASPRWPEAYLAVFTHDFEASFARVEAPILVMSGPEDILWPYFEPTLRLRPDARSAVLPGGAYVLDQHTDDVVREYRAFLGGARSAD
jgi:pimeloyl-ACP methyl ester carboxylesterase